MTCLADSTAGSVLFELARQIVRVIAIDGDDDG